MLVIDDFYFLKLVRQQKICCLRILMSCLAAGKKEKEKTIAQFWVEWFFFFSLVGLVKNEKNIWTSINTIIILTNTDIDANIEQLCEKISDKLQQQQKN